MATMSNFHLLLIFTQIKLIFGRPAANYILPKVKENFTMTSHLEYPHIKKVCNSRYSICKSNNTNVCGVRYYHNQVQYEDFENSCFMFLRNMCDNPGEEYFITWIGTCKDFFRNNRKETMARRDDNEEADEGLTADQDEEETNTEQETEANPEETEQNDENHTEYPEQENITAHDDGENNSQNQERQEEEDELTTTEANENDEEVSSNENDDKATEPTKEENSVRTTQSVDASIETIRDKETDITTPLSRIKHSKSFLSGGNNKGKRNKGKTIKYTSKKAKEQGIFADVTKPISRIKYTKAVLRKKANKKQTKTPKKKNDSKSSKAKLKVTTTKTIKDNKAKQTSPSKKINTNPTKGTVKTTTVPPKNAQATKPDAKPQKTPYTLYPVELSHDDHICPLSCPSTYNPICLSANRGNGLYFKTFTFINHCFGDIYYCKHPNDFLPPPDETESISISPISWSFCSASRYVEFARFTEVASSMGHYGWLAGGHRATHIMEPHERIPGFG